MRFGLVVAFASSALRICCGGELHVPEQFATIQAALNAAQKGDRVLVGPGTYRENLQVSPFVSLVSVAGASQTIIDGRFQGPVVQFGPFGPSLYDPSPTNVNELRGFTICYGVTGISIRGSAPTIHGCTVVSNRGTAGIEMVWSDALIVSNNITQNETTGIDVGGGQSGKILHNLIAMNVSGGRAGGIAINAGNELSIGHNRIIGNRGYSDAGGISMINRCDLHIYNNVIAHNEGGAGGIAWLTPSGTRGPRLVHNTISGNSVHADGYDQAAYIGNNIIHGELFSGNSNDSFQPIVENNLIYSIGGLFKNIGGVNGNIMGSPVFVNPEVRDFHLAFQSPGIDAAAPDLAVTIDLDGGARARDGNNDGAIAPDMGAYEYVPAPPQPPAWVSLRSEPSGIAVSWPKISDASSYVLHRALLPKGPFAQVISTTNSSHFDEGLAANQRYYYTVSGVNPFGEGPRSTPVSERAGNLPPVANPDVVQGVEDQFVDIRPLINDTDPNDDAIELLSVWRSPVEVYTVQDRERVLYAPPPNFHGEVRLHYFTTDGRGAYATGEVRVVIAPVNDPPFAHQAEAWAELGSTILIQLAADDPDSDVLLYELVEGPAAGRIQDWDAATGRVLYRTGRSLVSGDSFIFRARDAESSSSPVYVNIHRVTPPDLDTDGMPDIWERMMDINNPETDPDRDGAMNLHEYLANTDPRDPRSVLRFISIVEHEGILTLQWNAVGQMRYRLQRATGIGQPFADVLRSAGEEIFPAPEGVAGLAETVIPRLPGPGIYRIVALP